MDKFNSGKTVSLDCTVSAKKPPTPLLHVTEKMEQNKNKIASNLFLRNIKFYVNVEDGFTSLPANFGAIR